LLIVAPSQSVRKAAVAVSRLATRNATPMRTFMAPTVSRRGTCSSSFREGNGWKLESRSRGSAGNGRGSGQQVEVGYRRHQLHERLSINIIDNSALASNSQ
jgi:hypothetical protein